MAFVMKRVHGTGCLGPDLIELRERAGLTLAEACRETKVAPSFIRSLEEERWEDVPEPVYSERLLRLYVARLGGNESYYIHKYRECLKIRDVAADPSAYLPRPIRLRMKDLLVTPRLLAIGGFFIFVVLLGGYVYSRVRAISVAPPLALASPVEGQKLEEPAVVVSGQTAPEASLTINGKTAIVRPDGTFEETLYVPRGATMIVVSARKRHGDEAVLVRRVIYERDLPTTLPGLQSGATQ